LSETLIFDEQSLAVTIHSHTEPCIAEQAATRDNIVGEAAIWDDNAYPVDQGSEVQALFAIEAVEGLAVSRLNYRSYDIVVGELDYWNRCA
jgi:hypothetical protein